uniref:Uncharacterized protein n=1 Tax=Kalanchoe fedtschenkoi TaxID=63787 RepID=A0A7N0UZF4_KALFE
MASSPKAFRTSFHARSISLPSSPHPIIPEVEEILRSLKSSGVASSSSSIRNHLNGLHDLHGCLGDLLLLSETQQLLDKESNGRSVDQILDGSLRLLDVSGVAKDSLFQMKEFTHELQSALRRKGSDAKEAGKYLACRKNVKTSIQKTLRALKHVQATKKEHESLCLLSMLGEVEQVTLSVLESVLSLISGPKDKSLVSKLMHSKSISAEDKNVNEFEKIDAAMRSIAAQKTADISSIQSDLESLESGIEDIEKGIECLFRQLIKNRVTLLNIISH